MNVVSSIALLILLITPATVLSKSQKCEECEVSVELIHRDWGENVTEECTAELAIWVCEAFKIEDNFICDGIIENIKDEFMYVVGKIIVEPNQVCSLLIEDCGTFFDPLNVTWRLPMPPNKPTPVPKETVLPGNPTLTVLHLTDLHLDMYYTIGEEADCATPQCCRPQNSPYELNQADSIKQPAGKWGTVGNCDAPYWLLTNMLKDIKSTYPKIDYIMVTGDIMSHADWNYTPETHAAMIRNVSATIKSFFPGLNVFFSVGNHEGVPIDNIAPHSVPKKYHMDWLFEAIADSFETFLPNDQMKMVKYNGCYMMNLYPGFRIISLNNVYGDQMNFWLYINQTDPDGTMQWLINQLSDAERAGDKVHILSHIPGSNHESLEGWALNYYNVVNRFENTIVGQFFGHVHSEEFYMIYEDAENSKSRPTGVVYAAPSLTTYSEYYPAYRVYTIDGRHTNTTYQVIDFNERFLNLTKANSSPGDPVWEYLYESVNSEYGLNDQTPSEWNHLIERMKADNTLFNKYRRNFYRRNNFDGVGPCDEDCKKDWLCSARQFHHSAALCSDLGNVEV
ncbi:unnamed protein product [Auanema sp. JU1783]|nr:unnamed protein product [Auanema sp. JU1783]